MGARNKAEYSHRYQLKLDFLRNALFAKNLKVHSIHCHI